MAINNCEDGGIETRGIEIRTPFRPRTLFQKRPKLLVECDALESALTKHHGYRPVSGGKGSHGKLMNPGAPTIIIPGNRPAVSPGVVKHALGAIGGYPISRLPDLLNGRLREVIAADLP